ncbi:hypothetical protein, partial [Tolypothrix sp. VBCCA 56010]|uniref:hypothetical protein n=1 Tax=Tolypothrix sp. VBCCA 56010 TaxID=3137731 RepID=UPI003D7E9998
FAFFASSRLKIIIEPRRREEREEGNIFKLCRDADSKTPLRRFVIIRKIHSQDRETLVPINRR